MRFSYLGLNEPINLINPSLFSFIRSFRHKEPMLPPLTPSGVYALNLEETARFAANNEMAVYTSATQLIKSSDIIFCFLPDKALKGLASDLRGHGIKGKIFCHFSPAFNADILDFGEDNTYASFFIPSFEKLTDGKLKPSDMFIEGYGDRYDEILYVCKILGIPFHEINKNDKLMYLTAISMLTDFKDFIEEASKKLLKISLYNNYDLYEEILVKYKSKNHILNHYDPTNADDVRTIEAQSDLLSSIGIDDVSALYASLILAKARGLDRQSIAGEHIKHIARQLINNL